MPLPIEDYALIGDGITAALVGRDGSIDWLCWPRFDRPACFAALLGTPDHGHWSIAPDHQKPHVERRYRGETLVLETLFTTPDGTVAVIDFMPLGNPGSSVVRLVQGRHGRVAMSMRMVLRFDYGDVTPWVTAAADGSAVTAIAGPEMVVLHADTRLRGNNAATSANFSVAAGETVGFTLTHTHSHLPPPPPLDAPAALTTTERQWSAWAARCHYHGPYRDAVVRSLLTLKALVYTPTGGIVAAPTTSLPEQFGGTRNWDYRYCWLRDSALTIQAFLRAGYTDEARAWCDWLHRSFAGRPDQIQIMYGLAGERRLAEWEADWLPGYQGARPVRIGNGAAGQLQLDVFGEVMDALHEARLAGLLNADDWRLQVGLVERLGAVWDLPDEGMWEVRGGRQHFTHSKVMAWVAVDRAIADAERSSLPAPLAEWRRLRARIHRAVSTKGFDHAANTFTQTFGGADLDAGLLLIGAVGFLPGDHPRVAGTIAAVERHLAVDGLVRRYDTDRGHDGLPPGEGAFLPCSFWLVAAMARQGRRADARALFERLLALCNDVGLLAEEYDPVARRHLGNFPQAFSHATLVDAALAIVAVPDDRI